MDKSGWNMYVFRDGRRSVCGPSLVHSLAEAIRALDEAGTAEALLSTLLAAGELECALADAGSEFAGVAAEVTDASAEELVLGRRFPREEMLSRITTIEAPTTVTVSVHEGFAYYALHPLKFARILEKIELRESAGVVGIRSIGVALSAVMSAALRRSGARASRITVRPKGHPYDRELTLSDEQQRWVTELGEADFFVVDEGPGLSGSSFLATGEALERAGAELRRITLVGTRVPDPYGLRTTDAVRRWRRFRMVSTNEEPYLPEGAELPLGGGEWRDVLLSSADERPSSWTQLEALKYLSVDRKRFFRFEGYGHYGEDAAKRARSLAKAGFAPHFYGNVVGFGCYEFVDGREMTVADVDAELLRRIAAYCSFRAAEFRSGETNTELEAMTRFNWSNEFGVVLGDEFRPETVANVVCDGRMSPHEWRLGPEGQVLKVDASTDGDGHFFPGPCDIAWDLAGTIVEWGLATEETEQFLSEYERFSGDDPRERISSYLIAYSTLHMAYARMAARAMAGSEDEALFMRDYERYRHHALAAQTLVMPRPTVMIPMSQASESDGPAAA